ncbi:MAG: endonuclease [Bacteroidales bacterium]|nr:MAG: endonuclease [Bacteroidales bacterium]
MKTVPPIFSLILVLMVFTILSREVVAQNPGKGRGDLRIMFYNVENLFDTLDDPETRDEEFLPDSERYWTKNRYLTKLNNLCKVIIAIGGWEPPEIVGLCEVENRDILNDLVNHTPLSKYQYRIIHRDSPDERGIDVAMIYLDKYFKVQNIKYIPVENPGDPTFKTRDILYVKGFFPDGDTLHLFINHWPSRSGGQLETEPLRVLAASILRREISAVSANEPHAKVILMGDFNDTPEDRSIKDVLDAAMEFDNVEPDRLYNLSSADNTWQVKGSHKYQMSWDMLDQFIVSGSLIMNQDTMYVREDNFNVFAPDFLLEKDESNLGLKPFRTYVGFRYQNGFSDHLPVYLDIWKAADHTPR